MGGDEPEPEPGTIVEFVVDDITPKTPSTVHWNKAWFVSQTNICSLNRIESATINEAFGKNCIFGNYADVFRLSIYCALLKKERNESW